MTVRRHISLVAALASLAVGAAPAAFAMGGMGGMGDGMAGHGDMGGDAAGPAAGPQVAITFAAFATPRLDVVAGDTVHWMNDSARAHDVVADDQSFDSGRLLGGAGFGHRFDRAGTFGYYCSLHPFMTGQVDVHPLLLDAPAGRAGSGKPFVLSGRAAAGTTGTVTIEGDDGSGFRPAGTAAVGADGTFRTTVVPRTTTTYRAVSDAGESPAVSLLVLDHAVQVTTRARGRSTEIAVRVAPADPGGTVVLQLRLRDRFGWWPVQRTRLGRDSTARFTIARRTTAPARVLLTLPDGATELARSRTLQPMAPAHRH